MLSQPCRRCASPYVSTPLALAAEHGGRCCSSTVEFLKMAGSSQERHVITLPPFPPPSFFLTYQSCASAGATRKLFAFFWTFDLPEGVLWAG